MKIAKTTTSKVLRNSEIVSACQVEKSLSMLVLLLRKGSIHRSAVETIDVSRSL
ncbi:MAG: hypothetical protein AB9903_31950 [Vulcanimicrobiota bacterium]